MGWWQDDEHGAEIYADEMNSLLFLDWKQLPVLNDFLSLSKTQNRDRDLYNVCLWWRWGQDITSHQSLHFTFQTSLHFPIIGISISLSTLTSVQLIHHLNRNWDLHLPFTVPHLQQIAEVHNIFFFKNFFTYDVWTSWKLEARFLFSQFRDLFFTQSRKILLAPWAPKVTQFPSKS